MQRHVAVCVLDPDVSCLIKQNFYSVEVIIHDGILQRSICVPVLRVPVRTSRQECFTDSMSPAFVDFLSGVTRLA